MSGLHRDKDPETSVHAAAKVDTTWLEYVVLECLLKLGDKGATTEELANILKIERVTVSPRLRPLCNKGFVQESDLRRVGKSGRKSIVWIANREQ